jgi:single-stranded-DNA-specific exonuclease
VRFGGHRAAAGFTADNEHLAELRDALVRRAQDELSGVELAPAIDIDAMIPLGRVNGDLIRALTAMAPFGIGNPEPAFLSRGVEVTDVRAMGDEGQHLRLRLRDGRASWPAVAFGFGGAAGEAAPPPLERGAMLDVVYTFCADRGSDGALELRIADFAPASA